VTSNTWFTVNLSQPRFSLASTSSTNKIFFGGGRNKEEILRNLDMFKISK
jgi:precorrin-6B methylase 2